MCVSVHVYRHCSLQGRYKDLLRFYQLNGSSFQCMSMKCSGFFSPVRVKRESLNELPMQQQQQFIKVFPYLYIALPI